MGERGEVGISSLLWPPVRDLHTLGFAVVALCNRETAAVIFGDKEHVQRLKLYILLITANSITRDERSFKVCSKFIGANARKPCVTR